MMIEKIKVSIILCFYNEEKYLAKAIQSILNSTYKNIELIIVNDGSTDNSDSIVKSFIDSRIVYISNTENHGLAYSRNCGLDVCTGDYVGFFDGDDIQERDRVSLQCRYLNEHPDVVLVGGAYRSIDMEGNIIRKYLNGGMVSTPFLSNEQVKAYMLFCNCMASGGSMFRRDIIINNNIRNDVSLRVSQDYLFWLTVLQYGKVKNLNKTVYFYRCGHTSHAKSTKKKMGDKYDLLMIDIICYAWESRGFALTKEELTQIYYWCGKGKKIKTLREIRLQKEIGRRIENEVNRLSLQEANLIVKYYKKYVKRSWPGSRFVRIISFIIYQLFSRKVDDNE